MMIRLCTGNSRMEKKWNLAEMELSDFRGRISTTRRTSETVEQYRKMSKAWLCPRHPQGRSAQKGHSSDPLRADPGYGLRYPGHHGRNRDVL